MVSVEIIVGNFLEKIVQESGTSCVRMVVNNLRICYQCNTVGLGIFLPCLPGAPVTTIDHASSISPFKVMDQHEPSYE